MDFPFVARLVGIYLNGIRYDHWSKEQMTAHRKMNLEKIRAHALNNSPFYKKFHKGLESAPLDQLPPLTKSDIMDNFDEIVTDKAVNLHNVQQYIDKNDNSNKYLNEYRILSTSGSTGHPGLFLYNRKEWAHITATFASNLRWAGIIINPFKPQKRTVVASTSPWHISTQIGITMEELKIPGRVIPANQPLHNIVDQLNEYQPDEMVIYASMAIILADEQLAGRLKISPKTIFTTSEVLTENNRKKLKQVWPNVNPVNQYSLTEGGCIGGQCAHENMHFMDHNCIFEVVDDNYKAVKPGHYGTKLLMTSFFHKTQPLIRYEISDSIKLATHQCKCGRPHTSIADIQGRSQQIVHLPGTKIKDVQIHPVSFHHVMDLQPIQLWQLTQNKNNDIQILVSQASSKFSENKLIEDLKKNLTNLEAQIPHIEVHKVNEIPKEKSGKTPYIKILK